MWQQWGGAHRKSWVVSSLGGGLLHQGPWRRHVCGSSEEACVVAVARGLSQIVGCVFPVEVRATRVLRAGMRGSSEEEPIAIHGSRPMA